MKHLIGITCATLLASCGTNDEPAQPTVNTSVTVGPGGVSASTSVGVRVGGVSVRVGL